MKLDLAVGRSASRSSFGSIVKVRRAEGCNTVTITSLLVIKVRGDGISAPNWARVVALRSES